MEATKNKVGRPLKFNSVEELQGKIDEYFKTVGWVKRDVYDKKKQELVSLLVYEPATITGLAVALDTSRQTLCDYEEKEEYFDAIKRAKSKCEHTLEYGALAGHLNPVMAIFSAKNNYHWKDKSETESTVKFTDGAAIAAMEKMLESGSGKSKGISEGQNAV